MSSCSISRMLQTGFRVGRIRQRWLADCRLLNQRLPTCRTRRMWSQPYINTLDMKSMVTFWQDSYFLTIHKISEAYRTICRRNTNPCTVHHHRNLTQHSLLQPCRSQAGCCLLLRLKSESPATPYGAPHYWVQSKGTDQCTEQSCQDYQHVSVEIRLGGIRATCSASRWRVGFCIKKQAVWAVMKKIHH